jgi:hypothetical protein
MKEPSFNYSYTPTVDHRESNLYREEYYSSTDTKIYFDGDIHNEISFIQYEIQEQLKPVYGYNSRTFDDVIIGNRIVTGTFTVPIKNKEKQEFVAEEKDTNKKELNSKTERYNSDEEQKLQNTEWYGSTIKNVNKNNNNNIDSEVLTKLASLGYNVNTNSSYEEYERAIKNFQKDNNLTQTGINNEATMDLLNENFNKLNGIPVNLSETTGYYDLGLTKHPVKLNGNGIILNKVSVSGNEVYEILNEDGKRYYVKGSIYNE